MSCTDGLDFEPYLQSICTTYKRWWSLYIEEDVKTHTPVTPLVTPTFFADLVVQTWQPKKSQVEESLEPELKQETTEKLPILEGLRKYAPEHVLLMGAPGSGKSTTLHRLLLEEAQAAKKELTKSQIPVLLELRDYKNTAVELIQNFLENHHVLLSLEQIQHLLSQGKFLLLIDGLNELPSEVNRRDLQTFYQTYQTNTIICTTRDLSLGGDLGIAKKLEIQPLTEVQIQQFVRVYLPQKGEQMLRQLGNRLRRFGQTPLLLLMLCGVFQRENSIPNNLGMAFRQFADIYDRKAKPDVQGIEEHSRTILCYLAFKMLQGTEATEFQLSIPKETAEKFLSCLQGKHELNYSRQWAREWLKKLLQYHLIQQRADSQVEFKHQLLQEYYAAEYLLKILPELTNDQLKRNFLNYLKWTEPLALMLTLLDDIEQAVRVVKLALEVDLYLGARLAGEVQWRFQPKTVKWLAELEVLEQHSSWGYKSTNFVRIRSKLKVELLGKTRSETALAFLKQDFNNLASATRCSMARALGEIGGERAISVLKAALKDSDSSVRKNAVEALGKIGTESVIPALMEALKDSNYSVCSRAVEALGEVGTESAIPALMEALKDSNYSVCRRAVKALGEVGTESAILALIEALQNSDYYVRSKAVEILGQISSESSIPALIEALKLSNSSVCLSAVEALGKIGTESAIAALQEAVWDYDYYVSRRSLEALGKIGSEGAVAALQEALLHSSSSSIRRNAVKALGKIGTESAIAALQEALRDSDSSVRWRAAETLRKISTESSIPAFTEALLHSNPSVCLREVEVLAQIGNNRTIPALIKALQHSDYYVRWSAVEILGQIGDNSAIPALKEALLDFDYYVRWRAVEALNQIGTEVAVAALIEALKDSVSFVCLSAVEALGEMGTETAVTALIEFIKDSDKHVRWRAVEALGQIGSESAIPTLIEALKHSDYYVRWKAMEALGEIGTEGAVVALIEALKHSEDYFSRRVVEALGQIGSNHAIPALKEALQHSDSSVRWKAVEALGKIGTENVIPTLIKALQHSDDYVRLSAVEALGKIGNESALPSLLRLQLESRRDYIRDAIFAIQERCQFYNYNIYQLGQVSFSESIPQLSAVAYNFNKPRENSQLKMSSDNFVKKILVLAANPKGSKGLRLQEEEREIKERLRLAGYGKMPINTTSATRPRDIQQAMVDFKPQIVHFSGHGAGQDGLVFEDAIGQEKLVTSEALASLFELFSDHVECVVLNACYSEFQAEAVARHINYVVGMNQSIGDPAAIEFSVGFYTALGAGESYEFAYKLGCSAIKLEGIQEHLTPTLKKNNRTD